MGWRTSLLGGALQEETETESALTPAPMRQHGSPGRMSRFVNVSFLSRKEVIQPHLPVRLPCYDFTPLTRHTFGTVPCLRS